MFKDLFQIYKIGKDLGLSKKEVKSLSLFGNSKHPVLYIILMIVSIVATVILIFFLGILAFRRIYPSGALYSSVNEKDFKRNKGINLR
ncbi:MAG: hypothetical protein ACFFA3_07240 [Promethearchaeota archaeon]